MGSVNGYGWDGQIFVWAQLCTLTGYEMDKLGLSVLESWIADSGTG